MPSKQRTQSGEIAPGTGLLERTLLLLCVGILASSTFAQEKDRRAIPRSYESFLWLFDESKPGPELFAALKALGIRGTNVAGTASASAQAQHRIPFYLDHVAGKGILYLKDESFLPVYRAWLNDRNLPPLVRPEDIFSDDVKRRALTRIRQVLAPYRSPEAWLPRAMALDDEISFSRRLMPVDFGFSPLGLKEFRAWLKRRCDDIEALNSRWDTRFDSFDKVVPLTTAEIRRREFIKDPLKRNFAPWADHRRFIEEAFAGFVRQLCVEARRGMEQVPVGFTGGSFPHPFSGVNWSMMLKDLDFCEPYDVGGTRELVRSFARGEVRVWRTLFPDSRHPRASQHELWDYFLRGDRGVIIWSSRHVFSDPETLVPTPWAKGLTSTLNTLQSPALRAWMAASPPRAEIALVESQASVRAHWLLDSALDGADWVRRLGDYEIQHNSQNFTRESWQKLLEDLYLDYEHISAENLHRQDLSQYKVLVLPRTIALSDRAIKAIKQFARSRTVIADSQCALFDENLKTRSKGGLDDFFGIRRRNRSVNLRQKDLESLTLRGSNTLLAAEPGLQVQRGVASTLRLEEVPCMILKRHGRSGRSIYLNLLTHNYLAARRLDEHSKLLDELRGVFRITGTRPFAEIRTKGPVPPIRIHHRESADADYVAILRNWRQSVVTLNARQIAAMKSVDIEVLLPRASVIVDLLTPKRTSPLMRKQPRRRSSKHGTLTPFAPLIFKLPKENHVSDR